MKTIIDREDLAKVREGIWYAIPEGRKWRVKGRLKEDQTRRLIYLHRYLLDLNDDEPGVDHINQNGLDNRKCNLRLATQRIQILNRGLDPRNTSGYRGVSKKGYRWMAMGWLNYKPHYLGCYDTPEEASYHVEDFYATC
jgi:hypothetical protein